jgi:hypothetical protein
MVGVMHDQHTDQLDQRINSLSPLSLTWLSYALLCMHSSPLDLGSQFYVSKIVEI